LFLDRELKETVCERQFGIAEFSWRIQQRKSQKRKISVFCSTARGVICKIWKIEKFLQIAK